MESGASVLKGEAVHGGQMSHPQEPSSPNLNVSFQYLFTCLQHVPCTQKEQTYWFDC